MVQAPNALSLFDETATRPDTYRQAVTGTLEPGQDAPAHEPQVYGHKLPRVLGTALLRCVPPPREGGLTLTEISRRSGVALSTLSEWRSDVGGREHIHEDHLLAVARAIIETHDWAGRGEARLIVRAEVEADDIGPPPEEDVPEADYDEPCVPVPCAPVRRITSYG